MRLAYADPPYVGQSGRYDHPEATLYDDPGTHLDLMASMDDAYDGWALSCSAPSLRYLLSDAPSRSRVAAWVKPFAAYKANVRVAYTWEPVLFAPARLSSQDGAMVTRDHLSAPITLEKGLVGAKPIAFVRWVLDLMGYLPADEVTDLFPGTGIMGAELAHARLF